MRAADDGRSVDEKAPGPDGADGSGPRRAGDGVGGDRRTDDLLARAVDRMAHQIKNPLQAVAMNMEVIRTRVRREVPELWEGLERYAGAVDENVELLDRRLRLLLALGRRSPDDDPESLDPESLARDFAAALRLDREDPPVEVEGRGEGGGAGLGARGRPGFVLALLLDVWEAAREAGARDGKLRVRVEEGEGHVRLEVRLPPTPGGGGIASRRADRWRRLGRDAGGSVEVAEGGVSEDGEETGSRLRLVLPSG